MPFTPPLSDMTSGDVPSYYVTATVDGRRGVYACDLLHRYTSGRVLVGLWKGGRRYRINTDGANLTTSPITQVF